MPGLGRTQQIVLMTLVWAGALIGVDKRFNVHPERAQTSQLTSNPQLTLTINHFCCSSCYQDIFQVLTSNSWLTHPVVLNRQLLSQTQQDKKSASTPSSVRAMTDPSIFAGDARADVDKNAIAMVDLMRVHRAIASKGMVDSKMVLSGIPHFRLICVLPHFCCGGCSDAARMTFQPLTGASVSPTMQLLKLAQLPIVSLVDKTVTLEYRDYADIDAVIDILRKTGFVPSSIRVQVIS